MDYCINHTSERAVGRCGTCKRPACYRCSLTIDQVIYCSTACFNERPAKARVAAAPSAAELADEFSDVVAAIDARVGAAERAAAEPSVVLSAHMADDHSGTTMLGLSPLPSHPLEKDGSTLVMAGTRRALLSSSCFFHPDTSAVVLCAKCRNPICTLCAKEAPEGLACSPSCGPTDLVGIRERRKGTVINFVMTAAVVLVLLETGFLIWAGRNVQERLSSARIESSPAAAIEAPPPSADPEIRKADSLVQEAQRLLRDAADGAEIGRRPGNDAAALTSWLSRTSAKLRQARDLYAGKAGESPDPELKKRLETVTQLLDSLRVAPDPASDPGRAQNASGR